MKSNQPISHVPLEFIAATVTRVPLLLALASLLLGAASVWYTASFMTLRTARNDLLSPDLPYNQRYLAFVEEFSTLEGGLIVVDATDPDRAIAYAKDLVADLDPRLPVGTRTKFRIEDEAFLEKAILLLPPEELERIASAVAGGADLIGGALTPRGLESLFDGIGTRAAKAGGRGDFPPEALPSLARLIRGLSDAVAGMDQSDSLLAGWSDSKGRYFWSDDGRFLFIEIQPYPELDAGLSAIVRESMDRVAPRHPGLEVGLTGRPVLAHDEMEVVSRDMLLASVVSVVGVAALFILFFRNFFQPLLAVLTLMVGIMWSFGAATLIIGHLNLLSVIFGVILVGLGIDFGIHYLARYQEARRQGSPPANALREAMVLTGGGIVTGAMTMACAFFATAIGTFLGIAEMGIISGVGMILCLISMLILFPSLLILTDRSPPGRARPQPRTPAFLVRLYRHPLPLLVLSVLLTGAALVGSRGTEFQYSLLELQVQELESVRYERKLIAGEGMTTWFCASLCESLEEARARTDQFEALPTVRKVDGLPRILPERQEARLASIRAMRETLEGLPERTKSPPEINVKRIREAILRLAQALDRATEAAFEAGEAAATETLSELAEDAGALADRIAAAPDASDRLAGAQVAFQDQLAALLERFERHLPDAPLRLEDLPEEIRGRFLGAEGHYLLMVYPRENIWELEPQERFLEDVRSVDPEVTGAPVQVYESTGLMIRGYGKAGVVALLVVFAVLMIDFRDVRAAVLAITPLLMGAVWMVGVMKPLGLEFNSANLVVLPLILGIGVVDGVHIMHRYREKPGALADILWGSTGKAVLLTSLTTIVGCGAIGVLSQHPGLSSLGFVLSVGVAACLLSCWLALPPLMQLFYGTARRASRKQSSGGET